MSETAEFEPRENWIERLSLRAAPSTVKNWTRYFDRYVGWTGKTPQELWDIKRKAEAKISADNFDPREGIETETGVSKFIKHLEQEGYSKSTREVALNAVKSFYAENRTPLFVKALSIPKQGSNGRGSKIPYPADVAKTLNYCRGKKTRTALLCLKDSGLRLSDLVQLRWQDMNELDGFAMWDIDTEKVDGVIARPFIGPEALQALRALRKPNSKGRIFKTNPHELGKLINQAIREAKIKGVSCHGLRKFFINQLRLGPNPAPDDFIYTLCGKSTRDNGAYSESRADVLLEIYAKNYHKLQVLGNGSEDINDLRSRTAVLEAEIANLRGAALERDKLRKELRELRERVDAFLLLHGT